MEREDSANYQLYRTASFRDAQFSDKGERNRHQSELVDRFIGARNELYDELKKVSQFREALTEELKRSPQRETKLNVESLVPKIMSARRGTPPFHDLMREHLPDPTKLTQTLFKERAAEFLEPIDRERNALLDTVHPLAISIAGKLVNKLGDIFRHVGMTIDDLIQDEMLAAHKALFKYKEDRGASFGTFAHQAMTWQTFVSLRDNGAVVKRPTSHPAAIKKIAKAQEELLKVLGRKPDIEELAAAVKMPSTRVEDVLTIERNSRPLSLQMELKGGKSEGDTLQSITIDAQAADPFEALEQSDDAAILRRAMNLVLNDEERSALLLEAHYSPEERKDKLRELPDSDRRRYYKARRVAIRKLQQYYYECSHSPLQERDLGINDSEMKQLLGAMSLANVKDTLRKVPKDQVEALVVISGTGGGTIEFTRKVKPEGGLTWACKREELRKLLFMDLVQSEEPAQPPQQSAAKPLARNAPRQPAQRKTQEQVVAEPSRDLSHLKRLDAIEIAFTPHSYMRFAKGGMDKFTNIQRVLERELQTTDQPEEVSIRIGKLDITFFKRRYKNEEIWAHHVRDFKYLAHLSEDDPSLTD